MLALRRLSLLSFKLQGLTLKESFLPSWSSFYQYRLRDHPQLSIYVLWCATYLGPTCFCDLRCNANNRDGTNLWRGNSPLRCHRCLPAEVVVSSDKLSWCGGTHYTPPPIASQESKILPAMFVDELRPDSEKRICGRDENSILLSEYSENDVKKPYQQYYRCENLADIESASSKSRLVRLHVHLYGRLEPRFSSVGYVIVPGLFGTSKIYVVEFTLYLPAVPFFLLWYAQLAYRTAMLSRI